MEKTCFFRSGMLTVYSRILLLVRQQRCLQISLQSAQKSIRFLNVETISLSHNVKYKNRQSGGDKLGEYLPNPPCTIEELLKTNLQNKVSPSIMTTMLQKCTCTNGKGKHISVELHSAPRSRLRENVARGGTRVCEATTTRRSQINIS